VRWDVFARHREGTVFLGSGWESWMVWHFVLLRWEWRMETGPGRIENGGTHIRIVSRLETGRVYIKSDCTVRRRCNCYLFGVWGRHFASAGADINTHSYSARIC